MEGTTWLIRPCGTLAALLRRHFNKSTSYLIALDSRFQTLQSNTGSVEFGSIGAPRVLMRSLAQTRSRKDQRPGKISEMSDQLTPHSDPQPSTKLNNTVIFKPLLQCKR